MSVSAKLVRLFKRFLHDCLNTVDLSALNDWPGWEMYELRKNVHVVWPILLTKYPDLVGDQILNVIAEVLRRTPDWSDSCVYDILRELCGADSGGGKLLPSFNALHQTELVSVLLERLSAVEFRQRSYAAACLGSLRLENKKIREEIFSRLERAIKFDPIFVHNLLGLLFGTADWKKAVKLVLDRGHFIARWSLLEFIPFGANYGEGGKSFNALVLASLKNDENGFIRAEAETYYRPNELPRARISVADVQNCFIGWLDYNRSAGRSYTVELLERVLPYIYRRLMLSNEIVNSHKHPRNCDVCGSPTMPQVLGSFEICRVCKWLDDLGQRAFPRLRNGANEMSMIEFKRFRSGMAQERSTVEDIGASIELIEPCDLSVITEYPSIDVSERILGIPGGSHKSGGT